MNGNPTMLRQFRPAASSAPVPATWSVPVVTNLSVHIEPLAERFSDCDRDCDNLQRWYRIEKDLCLYGGERKAWLYVELTNLDELTAEDLVVTDIAAGVVRPASCADSSWRRRNGQLFVRREKFTVGLDNAVTAVDVLFGEDAVDPRPRWVLLQSSLQLDAPADKPAPRLTFLRGRPEPILDSAVQLRASENGEIKIVQMSDMHLRTGVGTCGDAMERDGTRMGEIRADRKTLSFVETILEKEKPNLVILGGDQLHHDIDDSQTAIFKAAAPMIAHCIPWVVVFGNHDDEGPHALSRKPTLSSESRWQGTIDHDLDRRVNLCKRPKGPFAKTIIRVEAAATTH